MALLPDTIFFPVKATLVLFWGLFPHFFHIFCKIACYS